VRGDVRDRPRSRDGAHAGALALAVIVVAAFAGCGGGGDDGESAGATSTSPQAQTSTSTTTTSGNGGPSHIDRGEPKQQVRKAVEAVLTSGDAADACGRYVTEHYLKAAYGDRQGCVQAQAPTSAARKLDFNDLRISGDRATAVVVPSGGPYDSERVTVSLVRDGPRWAVDELEANVPVGP
jgi:hypothetical protein